MKLLSVKKRLIGTIAVLAMMLTFSFVASAQKSEHYNSPLYSPKYYDPSSGTANGIPDPLKRVGIEQRLGESLPLDAEFKDENGNIVKLGSYFGKGRPVVLALVYYECPMLCNQILNGLTGTLKGVSFDAGKEFDVVAVSFDPKEFDKPELAKNKKASYMERYARPGTEGGWHFLTGQQASIDAITKAAGFKYEWDEKSEQFAHGSGIMIVTPDGKLSRYLYGIDYSPKDVKFSLMESAESKVGGLTDELLLYCFHYDPSTGTYGFQILSAMRIAAIATLLGMGLMGFVFWRRNKGKNAEADNIAD